MNNRNDNERIHGHVISVAHYEAFTDIPGKGNPAGVVFDADQLSAEDMQTIAQQVGFNETAFLLESDKADIRIRFFTPGHEMNLCGHGTVASIFGWMKKNKVTSSKDLRIETLAGILDVHYDHANQEIRMAQASAEFIEFSGNKVDLIESIGLSMEDIDSQFPVVYGSTGIWTLILPIRNLEAFMRMKPQNGRFKDILTQMPRASVHPICLETYDPISTMHGRHFSSSYSGTIEDPVTGTASGVMGAYYMSYVKSSERVEVLVEQGNEIGRKGMVRVYGEKNHEAIHIHISGKAVFISDMRVTY